MLIIDSGGGNLRIMVFFKVQTDLFWCTFDADKAVDFVDGR